MKIRNFVYIILAILLVGGCSPDQYKENTLKGIQTGVDPNQWVLVPAGAFYSNTKWRIVKEGEEIDSVLVGPYYTYLKLDTIPYDFEIMATEVTYEQYAKFLNEAYQKKVVWLDGDTIKTHYHGDPFTHYKHEFPVPEGDYPVMILGQPGLHIKFSDGKFTVDQGYENHPVVYVTWFGAYKYAEFYGYRLPKEKEWEKAARGRQLKAYPWGNEIVPEQANYHLGHIELEKVFGEPARTTPVGFYNGKTYKGPYGEIKTIDNRSPYGAYDMAGNVWEWCGDDYPFIHYRYMRGGSYVNYDYNVTTWARNNAEPWYSSPWVGFRCVRDVKGKEQAKDTVVEVVEVVEEVVEEQ